MNRPVSMAEIITHVCKRYGLDPEVLAQPGKKRDWAEARAVIALLVWYEDHLSLTDPCTRFSRDLTSLSQAVNRLRTRAETNLRPAAELDRMKENPAQMRICQA
jgi:chromosomal replication initiation ATPase DnaA